MVIASTGNAMSLEALAQMADKIVEVATPTISAINAPHISSEVDQQRKEVAHLREIISSLNTSRVAPDPLAQEDAHPAHTQQILLPPLVGIIAVLGKNLQVQLIL